MKLATQGLLQILAGVQQIGFQAARFQRFVAQGQAGGGQCARALVDALLRGQHLDVLI